jgi:hypothetical protein
MKRNNPDILDTIIESISKGNGRVQSCHMAKISYDTFCDIINPLHRGYNIEFVERLKKAEDTGRTKIKELCESVILKAATDQGKPVWQAAAWMLERKFNKEYGLKQELTGKDGKDLIPDKKLTDEERKAEIAVLKAKLNVD